MLEQFWHVQQNKTKEKNLNTYFAPYFLKVNAKWIIDLI